MADFPPIHPGEILETEFLEPMGLSQNKLALALRVPVRRINEIVRSRRGISADTALRLSRYFGTTARFWMNLQTAYELQVTLDAKGAEIERDVLVRDQ
jgi:addiction module HigA family antidote